MLLKNHKFILLLIVFLGFFLRLYGAISLPLCLDEKLEFYSARQISFNPDNLNLPLVVEESMVIEEQPVTIGHLYLIKLGFYFFGESSLGGRLPFVLLGTIAIFLVYFIIKPVLGVKTGLLAALLLSISQYHIGLTQAAHSAHVVVFLTLFSIFLFYKTLQNPSKRLIFLNGLVIGIGYLIKESMILIIPVYGIFLAISSQYRKLLKGGDIWIFFGALLVIILPHFYLSLSLDVPRVEHGIMYNLQHIKPSINAASIYLGELVLYALRFFPQIFEQAVSTRDIDLPAETFVFGIVILAGAIYSLKDRRPLIKLLLIFFLFNFALFSCIRSVIDIDTFWSLGDLSWASIGFVPGVILAANVLSEVLRKQRYGKGFVAVLVIFMLIRALDHVTFPLNAQVPIRDFHIERNIMGKASWYIQTGDKEGAKNILQRVYRLTGTRPDLRARAALKLFQVLPADD